MLLKKPLLKIIIRQNLQDSLKTKKALERMYQNVIFICISQYKKNC